MKKIVLIILSFMVVGQITAQKDKASSLLVSETADYKATAGSHSLEINFNPANIFANAQNNQFGLFNGAIKYRKFSDDTHAFRLLVGLSYLNQSIVTQQEDRDNGDLELRDHIKIFGLTFQPGFEKHFDITPRVSPYVGMEALMRYRTTNYISEYQDSQIIYQESWRNDPSAAGAGYILLGGGLIAGVDYYFAKKLYIGLEVGYGLVYTKFLDVYHEDENDSSADYDHKTGSLLGGFPYLTTGNFRIGWVF